MIVVREVFQLHYGKAREAMALVKEMSQLGPSMTAKPPRLLTDVVGPYYTLIMEAEFENLAAFEKAMSDETGAEGFRDLNARFAPLVMEGRREIYRIVE
ncbi:MAG TPA: hypothetical protein VFD39_00745 [Trueperaceae bacterium]|nr:hypothetical protein [Trueperaceae bacterium]